MPYPNSYDSVTVTDGIVRNALDLSLYNLATFLGWLFGFFPPNSLILNP
jgi:hypothetical protein